MESKKHFQSEICLWVIVLLSLTTLRLDAALEAQKQTAIDNGLKWLAQTQGGDGHWNSYYSNNIGTALAVRTFLNKGYQAGTDVVLGGTNYGDVVGRGMNYLFNQLAPISIGMQPAGNPDFNGNGIGVCSYNNSGGYHVYTTSTMIMALAAANTSGMTITTGSQAGRLCIDVAQDMVDYLAFAQNDASTGINRGGWGYGANYGGSYQECAPWAALALQIADRTATCYEVPAFVRTESNLWSHNVQYYNGSGTGYDGASYFTPNTWPNESMTGGLLAEFTLGGYDVSYSRMQAALGYLNRNWTRGRVDIWSGNFGNEYSMWQIYMGLSMTVGLDDTSAITNLRGCGDLDSGRSPNWYEDYCQYLVQNQFANGSWAPYYQDQTVTTAWNVDIITVVPEPTVMVLLCAGLWGLRKRAR